MISRNLKSSMLAYEADGRWEGPCGQILVEVKKTSSMRDVRDAFLALAYLIADEPTENKAVCVLVKTRLSCARLQEELVRFRQVIHPAIASRIHFLLDKGGVQRKVAAFIGSMEDAPSEFYGWLAELAANERLNGHARQLPQRQSVMVALAQLRLWNEAPVTVKFLQETCRVSYPTVAAVLKDLADQGWLDDGGERGVRLRYLTTGEWMTLARDHARQRKVHLFTDPTGQGSPEQMAKRLARLQEANKLPKSIRVGGVIGASGHFPALDITAAPRLDLSVEADPAQIAAMLDAGLQPKTKPEQRVALAVHVTHDPWVITDQGSTLQEPWAGELECLSDLIEMGYKREASEMAQHMEQTNKEGRPST
jgi:CRP-like cAMP-binding protein